MDNLTPVFILLTGFAVMLQAGILVAMYVAMRKSSAHMEALATEVKDQSPAHGRAGRGVADGIPS